MVLAIGNAVDSRRLLSGSGGSSISWSFFAVSYVFWGRGPARHEPIRRAKLAPIGPGRDEAMPKIITDAAGNVVVVKREVGQVIKGDQTGSVRIEMRGKARA